MRWGHATRLPKPPYADSRRHSGVNASILARAPRGNRPPEWSTILAQGLLRPARRSQSCLHTPIRTPVSLHRTLLFAEVLRRPVESALDRPVKPGDDDCVCVLSRNRSPPGARPVLAAAERTHAAFDLQGVRAGERDVAGISAAVIGVVDLAGPSVRSGGLHAAEQRQAGRPSPHLLTRTWAPPAWVSQMPVASPPAWACAPGAASSAVSMAMMKPNRQAMEISPKNRSA